MASCTRLLFKQLTATAAFEATGDEVIARGGTMDQFSLAIDSGIRIAMMYGDRDYTCNCRLLDPLAKLSLLC
jgi:hypothetical protein